MSKVIGIVGNRLVPFNEAYANQMRVLARVLGAQVLTSADLGPWPLLRCRPGYCFLNSRFVERGTPISSQLNGALLYLVLKWFESRCTVVLLAGGVESRFLRYLSLEKCVPVISTIDDQEAADRFAREIAPRLRGIIVQSDRVRERLIRLGVASARIKRLYPLVNPELFDLREEVPPLDPFRILFASAPNVQSETEDNFRAKGVDLLLAGFRKFCAISAGELTILWRGRYTGDLERTIKELGLCRQVRVVNKIVPGMGEHYAWAHATVIPYRSGWRSPQLPLSAVESLAAGRPVVTTDVVEMAELVRSRDCGVACSPDAAELSQAFVRCRNHYRHYQRHCRDTAGELYRMSLGNVEGFL
jgi:glycosyltransferase involved in cell wall biosynthesis